MNKKFIDGLVAFISIFLAAMSLCLWLHPLDGSENIGIMFFCFLFFLIIGIVALINLVTEKGGE